MSTCIPTPGARQRRTARWGRARTRAWGRAQTRQGYCCQSHRACSGTRRGDQLRIPYVLCPYEIEYFSYRVMDEWYHFLSVFFVPSICRFAHFRVQIFAHFRTELFFRMGKGHKGFLAGRSAVRGAFLNMLGWTDCRACCTGTVSLLQTLN